MTKEELERLVRKLLYDSRRIAGRKIGDPRGRRQLNKLYKKVLEDLDWEFKLLEPLRPPRSRGSRGDLLGDQQAETTSLPGGESVTYKRKTCPVPLDLKRLRGHVTVFIPTRGSGHRLGSNLERLAEDLAAFPDHHAYELMFCVNNSDDDTIDEVLKFAENHPDLRVDIVEISKDDQISSKKRPTNILFQLNQDRWAQLKEEAQEVGNTSLRYFIHHHDDDITFHERGESGIYKNIEELRRFRNLQLTSGIYSTSRPMRGFGFVNTVRKRRELLEHVPPCLQVYGGAATQTLESFPPEGIPESARGFDAYMSSYLVAEKLRRTSFEEFNVYEMAARTNRHLLVEHPEETSFLRFLNRLVRDWEYGKKLRKGETRDQEAGRDLERERYREFRRHTHRSVNRLIEGLQQSDERYVGFVWYSAIRERAERLYWSHTLSTEAMDGLVPSLSPGVDPRAEYDRRVKMIATAPERSPS